MVANLINGIAIIIGSLLGISFKKFINKDISNRILNIIGVIILIFGFTGVFKAMITIEDGRLVSNYELILLTSLVLGSLIGELLKIDDRIDNFGIYLEKKLGKSNFSIGFINASLIFCIGAMAIVGSINAGLGDSNILYLKSIIDGVTALVLASTLGFGVVFASITVILYQGIFIILTLLVGDVFSSQFIDTFSMVGYAMIICIGINFTFNKQLKIGNLLPALLIVIIYNLF